jgi:membrane-associated protease RseP (regulator of RpoE activity)
MDVAIGGPLAGFVFCLLFLTYGYLTLPSAELVQAHVDAVHTRMGLTPDELQNGLTLTLGKSLLFIFFNDILGGGKVPMSEVYHFPFIFAGWVGLLVTAINLLPIGQLDGGHIVYALFAGNAKKISQMAFLSLVGLTVALSISPVGTQALMWIPLMLILSLIGLRHPPTLDDARELNLQRSGLGWLCILILFACFMPLPVYF